MCFLLGTTGSIGRAKENEETESVGGVEAGGEFSYSAYAFFLSDLIRKEKRYGFLYCMEVYTRETLANKY